MPLTQRRRQMWLDRIETNSIIVAPNDCRLWLRATVYGYGEIWFIKRLWRVHRLVWYLHNGPIPDGMQICHNCDIHRCVSIDHLFCGTHQDNMEDRDHKGRQARGITHASAKLTEQDVLNIRKLYRSGTMNQPQLAAMFGVTRVTIGRVVNRQLWKHI